MVLSPFTDRQHMRRPRCARAVCLVTLVLAAACSTRRPQLPPVQPPVARPDSARAPVQPTAPFRHDSAHYLIDALIVTTEEAAITRPDSSSYRENIHVRVTPRSDSVAEVTLTAADGFRRTMGDSTTAPMAPELHKHIPVAIRVVLQQDGVLEVDGSQYSSCPSPQSFLTPFLARLLASASISAPGIRADTIGYTICMSDVSIHSEYVLITSHQQKSQGDRTIDISATLSADSTRYLPMRIAGTVTGTATLQNAAATPRSLHVQVLLTADFRFTSAQRIQHISQHTRLTIRPDSR